MLYILNILCFSATNNSRTQKDKPMGNSAFRLPIESPTTHSTQPTGLTQNMYQSSYSEPHLQNYSQPDNSNYNYQYPNSYPGHQSYQFSHPLSESYNPTYPPYHQGFSASNFNQDLSASSYSLQIDPDPTVQAPYSSTPNFSQWDYEN
jgi:hypothetical protein